MPVLRINHWALFKYTLYYISLKVQEIKPSQMVNHNTYITIDWQLLHLPPHVVAQLGPGLTGESQLAHQLHSGPSNPADRHNVENSAPRRLICWMKDQASCPGIPPWK